MVKVYSTKAWAVARSVAMEGKDGVYTVSDNCGSATISTISQTAGLTDCCSHTPPDLEHQRITTLQNCIAI